MILLLAAWVLAERCVCIEIMSAREPHKNRAEWIAAGSISPGSNNEYTALRSLRLCARVFL
jgi:hypothetical protein